MTEHRFNKTQVVRGSLVRSACAKTGSSGGLGSTRGYQAPKFRRVSNFLNRGSCLPRARKLMTMKLGEVAGSCICLRSVGNLQSDRIFS